MKSACKILLVSALSLSVAACSNASPTGKGLPNQEQPKQEQKVKLEKAEDVVNALKTEGLPIGNQTVYNSENDPNKLLGRPGQYTSKVNFVDTRVKAELQNNKIEVINGGSVEMFNNEQEAKSRFDYISNIAKSAPIFSEYDYNVGKILLRVSKELTPEQAAAYESTLKKITN